MIPISIERVERFSLDNIAPILRLIDTAPAGDLGFHAGQFAVWSARALGADKTLVAVIVARGEDAGFIIAFGPFELDPFVFVFEVYVAPKWRNKDLILAVISYIKDWSKACGAKGAAFQSRRPRAWHRLLDKVATTFRVVCHLSTEKE